MQNISFMKKKLDVCEKEELECKVEKIWKGNPDSIPSPSPSVKIQIMGGKFAWGVKAKHYWALSTNVWEEQVCWHQPAMFCHITSIKLSRQ